MIICRYCEKERNNSHHCSGREAFNLGFLKGKEQMRKESIEIIDKMAEKEKAIEIDIGEYDKFLSLYSLKKQLEVKKDGNH